MPQSFDSSDAVRSARPLRHAQTVTFDEMVTLKQGGQLPAVTVAYETYGQLNAAKSNAVYICHALSGDSHVAQHDDTDDPGWWDIMVGPGKPIDTDRFFVICANILGGCRGTTGPNSIDPATGKPWGANFPTVTIEDMVDVQRRLIDHLGIDKLFAVIGGSLGGQMVLHWATALPDRLHAAVAIATAPRLTAQALAFDIVGRNAITRDPHFHAGQYYDKPDRPDVGLALARMLAHITYLSPQSMHEKFDADRHQPRDVATDFEHRFSVGSYLAHQGDKFVERFDANSYVTLTTAMDLFDLDREALGNSQCRWLVLSFTSDWLFTPAQSRDMVDALIDAGKCVGYCNVTSDAGHDAFLLEQDIDRYGEMIRATLDTTTLEGTFLPPKPQPKPQPKDILHHPRIDYDRIIELLPAGATILDLGCGEGDLLARLAHDRNPDRLVGVDVNEFDVLSSMRRGFDVVHADLNEGLRSFPDDAFDCIVLSQTLQSIINTEQIVDEVLRVGRKAIVSFPNFAYKKIREAVAAGRSPVNAGGLLHYAWYNTPNRRFLSIDDWREFCAERGIHIDHEIDLNTEDACEVHDDPNLNADVAICLISRA